MPQASLPCCSVVPSSKLIGCLLVNRYHMFYLWRYTCSLLNLLFLFFALSAQISVCGLRQSSGYLRPIIRCQFGLCGRRWPAWQARHRLSGALHAARPQGCATAGVEGPTGTDRKALRFGGPEGSYGRRAGERVICIALRPRTSQLPRFSTWEKM